jgi:hypothetical protein
MNAMTDFSNGVDKRSRRGRRSQRHLYGSRYIFEKRGPHLNLLCLLQSFYVQTLTTLFDEESKRLKSRGLCHGLDVTLLDLGRRCNSYGHVQPESFAEHPRASDGGSVGMALVVPLIKLKKVACFSIPSDPIGREAGNALAML